MALDILLVDDEPTLLVSLGDLIEDAGYTVTRYEDGAAAARSLHPGRYDVVLTDVRLPGMDGHALARLSLSLKPAPAVILMTAFGEVPRAVEMMSLGARDYLTKPIDETMLLSKLALIAQQQLPAKGDEQVVAEAPEMIEVLRLARRLARSDLPILIHGETGSGKDIVASFIHRHSSRSSGPFVPANCSAMPPDLIDSELFGHERGAFTGAHSARAGWFRSADGGTLFLDEVAELPTSAQARLLRALETGVVRPVGADRDVRADVRLVAATNADLGAMVRKGRFRDDLLFRLRGFDLVVPPLRRRPEDIRVLAQRFLRAAVDRLGGPDRHLDEAALSALLTWHWPGNVRELRHAIETAAVLADGPLIRVSDLPAALARDTSGNASSDTDPPTATLDLRDATRKVEVVQIRRALVISEGNREGAAGLLGISRKHLWELMRRDGIKG
ncbi:MAG: sigma-54-dependent Fis family transcriptional regulator [Oligoflexia bacterium]|nr:sigma-54-dependent Fis family transcriptional regulator [Oligoflexia bacterium]